MHAALPTHGQPTALPPSPPAVARSLQSSPQSAGCAGTAPPPPPAPKRRTSTSPASCPWRGNVLGFRLLGNLIANSPTPVPLPLGGIEVKNPQSSNFFELFTAVQSCKKKFQNLFHLDSRLPTSGKFKNVPLLEGGKKLSTF